MDRTTLYAHLLTQTGFLTNATSPAINKKAGCVRLLLGTADAPATGTYRDDYRLQRSA